MNSPALSYVINLNSQFVANDEVRFAREILLWGRKSDTILNGHART